MRALVPLLNNSILQWKMQKATHMVGNEFIHWQHYLLIHHSFCV